MVHRIHLDTPSTRGHLEEVVEEVVNVSIACERGPRPDLPVDQELPIDDRITRTITTAGGHAETVPVPSNPTFRPDSRTPPVRIGVEPDRDRRAESDLHGEHITCLELDEVIDGDPLSLDPV